MRTASPSRAETDLRAALDARRAELEEAILARVYGVADPSDSADPQYLDGLRRAVSAAVDYGFAALEEGSERVAPIPAALLVQARLAARNRISLETVLRRYHGGNTLFTEVLIEEAEHCELAGSELKRLFRMLATSFERLLAAVSEEHRREDGGENGERRRVALIERLLAGELLGSTELGYELGHNHLGLVVAGPGGAALIRELGGRLDRRMLLAEPDGETAWVWFGGQRPFEADELDLFASMPWPGQVVVGRGEPGLGLAAWRLSHRQAAAALPVAQRVGEGMVRYADVALLAAALRDDLLATSLRDIYLEPLSQGRKRGAAAKDTLRAYFAAAGNASSAAAALGVSRRTVASRLAAISERLGRPVEAASAELETVLRLEELEGA